MQSVPAFPLGAPILPGMTLPLRIFEDRYKTFAEDLVSGDKQYFVTVMIERGSEVGGGDERSTVGCLVDLDGSQQFDEERGCSTPPPGNGSG